MPVFLHCDILLAFPPPLNPNTLWPLTHTHTHSHTHKYACFSSVFSSPVGVSLYLLGSCWSSDVKIPQHSQDFPHFGGRSSTAQTIELLPFFLFWSGFYFGWTLFGLWNQFTLKNEPSKIHLHFYRKHINELAFPDWNTLVFIPWLSNTYCGHTLFIQGTPEEG